jgi:bifunctional polynucleotide phosphatase/kinase
VFIDYDWTIVKPQNNSIFPKNIDDWDWLRPNVPEIIKSYYDRGFGIYIVTNQSKDWKIQQIELVIAKLEIPVTICIANNKSVYKPSLFIYHEALSEEQRKKIKLNKSFMCGDALGRPNDHSDCDLKFAEAIGIKCISPEELFPFEEKSIDNKLKPKTTPEIIIMVGYPGSGKSTIISQIFEPADYFIAHGDDLKTSAKMIKAAEEHIKNGKSVVFDATNPSKEKRAEYIKFAKKHNIPVRCVYMSTSFEEAMARNNNREKPVPKIVYYIYKKKFEIPSEDEGFDVVIV